MADVKYRYEDNVLSVTGDVVNEVRIKPYLRERGLRQVGKKWMGYQTQEQVDDFLSWCSTRGWEVEIMTAQQAAAARERAAAKKQVKHRTSFVTPEKPKTKSTSYKAKTNNATYSYGKVGGEPNAQLRGGGLQHPHIKAYITKMGFRWTFRRGRRSVRAYESSMSPHKLIEVLIHLKKEGLHVNPSTSLSPKRWLYLDLPSVYETKAIKTGDVAFESLAVWLEAQGYTRLSSVEQPGDFAIRGDTFHVWTKQDDALIRIVFDGDTIESIAKVDPETLEADFTAEYTINGLVEIGKSEIATLPTPAEAAATWINKVVAPKPEKEPTVEEAMQMFAEMAAAPEPPPEKPKPVREVLNKYTPTHVQQMTKKFAKLDKDHPFFGMVKFNDPPTE